jgi:hypothetical protein
MRNFLVFCYVVCSVVFFGTGCRSFRDAYYANDPSTSVRVECTRTASGAQNCERHVESRYVGGASMYGGGGYYPGMYGGSYGQVAHPPIIMAPRGPQPTEAERAMEDIPGGVVLLHPGQQYATRDEMEIVVRQTAITKKEVKEMKKKQQDGKQKPSGEAAQ